MSNLVKTEEHPYANGVAFENAQRMAKSLSASTLVPKDYQGNMPNCLVALEVACRTGASPFMVMQNLNIIHGRPSWSSAYIIAAINSSGRFEPLRFEIYGEGDDRACFAWTKDKEGNRFDGATVSIKMAKDEGWLSKNGSKWKTMPDLMLRYRAASFFGRLYAPEILMGMQTQEEILDSRELRVVNSENMAETKTISDILNNQSEIIEHEQVLPNDGDALDEIFVFDQPETTDQEEVM